jgi:hypothetical protein
MVYRWPDSRGRGEILQTRHGATAEELGREEPGQVELVIPPARGSDGY